MPQWQKAKKVGAIKFNIESFTFLFENELFQGSIKRTLINIDRNEKTSYRYIV